MENKNVYLKIVRYEQNEDGTYSWIDGNGTKYHADKVIYRLAYMGYIKIEELDSANFNIIEGNDTLRKLYDSHEDTRNNGLWLEEGSTIYLEIKIIDKVQASTINKLLHQNSFLGFKLEAIHYNTVGIVKGYKNKILDFINQL